MHIGTNNDNSRYRTWRGYTFMGLGYRDEKRLIVGNDQSTTMVNDD